MCWEFVNSSRWSIYLYLSDVQSRKFSRSDRIGLHTVTNIGYGQCVKVCVRNSI